MSTTTLLLFLAGVVLLVIGAEFLVRGASKLASALGISPIVIGLTVVALGTGSPELAVVVQASWSGQGDMALGNVIGSNICNILFILGVSAMVAPLFVTQRLVRWDVPLMVFLSVLVWLMGFDGSIDRLDGAILVGGAAAYIGFAIWQSRREGLRVRREYQAEFGEPPQPGPRRLWLQVVLIVLGLGALTLGSYWLIDGAVAIAEVLGVSELIIGLTVVALGTSLPEAATSVMASLRNERDIAVGNVVGSNILNILAILGLAALIAPSGIPVPKAALNFDIPVMTAVAIVCLPIFFIGNRIARWEGAILFGYYIAYTGYLILSAQEHESLPLYNRVMLWFVIPMTVLTLFVFVVRQVRANRLAKLTRDSASTT